VLTIAVVSGLCFVMMAVLLHADQPFLAFVAVLIGLAVIWPVLVRYVRIPV
jgi:hypothetical protein